MRALLLLLATFGSLALERLPALTLENDLQTRAVITGTTVTLTGHSELHLTNSGDPIPGCIIHLNDENSWLFLHAVKPSATVASLLSRVRVNGAAAVNGSNVRVTSYGDGSVVIPHAPTFQPLEVYLNSRLVGESRQLSQYTAYGNTELGVFNDSIRSFTLKRGYMATFAANSNGTGASVCFVAQDSDLEVSFMPEGLDRSTSFVRVFPWRWTTKKGLAGNVGNELNTTWWYNWNLDQNSSLDREYVAIRQTRYWPSLNQNWKNRGINHLLGYNEPDNSIEANLSVTDAIAGWPDLLATGLRVGTPAPTDGGRNWLYNFVSQANNNNYRADFVAVHYYWCFNPSDPTGAANQFYTFLKDVYDTTGLPIWITEWNNGANWTNCGDPSSSQQAAAIAAIIAMLDNTPFVERYACYNWVEDARRLTWNDGWPTAAGVVYRDKASPLAHRQLVPNTGLSPVAAYPFDEDMRDSQKGNNPLVYGTPKLEPGKFGNALSLDGSDDYLRLPYNIGDSGDFTFTGWIQWRGGDNWQRIFDIGSGTTNYAFLSPKAGGSNALRFAIRQNNGTEQRLNWDAALPVNTWTHVTVTLAGNTGKLFVNGALVDTQTISLNPSDLETHFNYLGKSQFGADPLFNGLIDDARFLTTALSDGEVAALAASVPAVFVQSAALPSAPIDRPYSANINDLITSTNGPYLFEKVGGPAWMALGAHGIISGVPTLADKGSREILVRITSPGGANLTTSLPLAVTTDDLVARYGFDNSFFANVGRVDAELSGGTSWTSGRRCNALALNGTDGYATLPNALPDSDELTIASWVYWNGGNTWQRIFDFGSGTDSYLFCTPKADGSNVLRFAIKNGGSEQRLEHAIALPTGSWQHIALTLSNNVGKLYLNGSVIDTNTAMTLKPSDIEFTQNYLGKSQWPDPYFNGRIDEFHVFHRALSQPEISALQLGTPPSFTPRALTLPAIAPGSILDTTVAATSGDALTYKKTSGPDWLTVEADGRISGIPGEADTGSSYFRIRASTADHLADELVLKIPISGPASLVSHHEFNGDLRDRDSYFHGTASGSPSYRNGLFDEAISLDGSSDYVTLPSDIANSLTDATFVARIRWNGGNSWQRVFDFGNNTTEYVFLTPSSGAGTLRFGITTGGNGTQQYIEADAPRIGEWTHVAATLIGNTGTLYVNGAPVSSGTITVNPNTFAPTVNYLGKSQWPDPLFNGDIDDFRVYRSGLSAAQVQSLVTPPAATLVPRDDYAAWTIAQSFPANEDKLNDDPDGDGVVNGFEFLFATNPLVADPRGFDFDGDIATASELGIAGSFRYLVLTARVTANRSGLVLVAEGASDFDDFNESQALFIDSTPDGDFEILRWRSILPIDAATPNAFLRLKVSE